MNRLILIGNGFDLAHKMKTKYSDFIFFYLKDCFLKASKQGEYADDLVWIQKVFVSEYRKIEEVTNLDDLLFFKASDEDITSVLKAIEQEKIHKHYSKEYLLKVKSSFFDQMLIRCRDYDWVDIENEYYFHLKSLLTETNDISNSLNGLNSSFNLIREGLGAYLSSQHARYFNNEYCRIFTELICQQDIVTTNLKDHNPENLLILNFNYTRTVEEYFKNKNFSLYNKNIQVNYIHGNIDDENNPIIFGFGDELDKDYHTIESERRKGFLNFIKSFWYFKTSNYHNLIRFIDSKEFQVYILGHSCGLSDRTMLNMIYEHSNCKSIKIFYHGSKNANNYTELTQEISRHFNDKGIMRKKIVPFDLSQPMPQCDRK